LENEEKEVIIIKLHKPWESENAKKFLKELKILRIVNCFYIAGIVELIQVEEDAFEDVYLVLQEHKSDMQTLLKQGEWPGDGESVIYFYELFLLLDFAHTSAIYIRDLNPARILFTKDADIIVNNFGNCKLNFGKLADYFLNIKYSPKRLWNCAPEVFLNLPEQTCPAEIWALECIMLQFFS